MAQSRNLNLISLEIPVHTDHGEDDGEEDVEHVAARLVDEDA